MPLGFSLMRPGHDAEDNFPNRALRAHHAARQHAHTVREPAPVSTTPATPAAAAAPASAAPVPVPPATVREATAQQSQQSQGTATTPEEEPYEPLIAWQKLRKLY